MRIEFVDRVKETSTTTGTGAKALGGAVVGFQSFSDALPYGGFFGFEIHAVDAGGAPSGDWEVGIGYINSSYLYTALLLNSSNGGSAVSFAAGSKEISMTVPAAFCASTRIEGQTTIYVSPATGDTGNDGLSSGRPLSTLQEGVDAAVNICSASRYDVEVNLLDNSGAGVSLPFFSHQKSRIRISGATASVIIGGTISANGAGSGWELFQVTVGGGVNCLSIGRDSSIKIGTSVTFGSATGSQIVVSGGGRLYSNNGYNIAAGSSGGAHIDVDAGGYASIGGDINFDANCTFDQGFVRCPNGGGYIDMSAAVFYLNGYTATGQRYNINGNGVCWTNGGGASFLPGNSAGAETNGGKYL